MSLFRTPLAEIPNIVGQARIALSAWDEQGFEKRARLLKNACKELLRQREKASELIELEAGKPYAEALLCEAIGPLQYISDWAKVARPALRPRKLAINPLAFPGKSGVIELVPRGVVGIIAPWNYPLGNFFKPVFAALLCGNTVVLKPSEYSPKTATWFCEVLGQFLHPGVLTLVHGARDEGRALVGAGVDAVTFTGSYASGREVAGLCAELLIPCSLELGGKDAALVLADCDLDRTVAGILHWSLHNAGQACGDIERLYVEAAVADRFVAQLADAVNRLPRGDVGRLAHPAQLAVVQEHVADALAQGATLRCGGGIRTEQGPLAFEPTILEGCHHGMKVMKEPTFGPIIPICRVADAEEGVRLINDCDYGLNASIWSEALPRATALARRLVVGTAFVNNHAFTGAMPSAPWTGVKRSGYGIANSAFAINHYTRPRTLVVDRKRSPDAWWFPLGQSAVELAQCLGAAQFGRPLAALRIPGLIGRRQRDILKFARGGEARAVQASRGGLASGNGSASGADSGKLRMACSRLGSAAFRRVTAPRLFGFEIAWGAMAVEAIFLAKPGASSLPPLAPGEFGAFLQDFHETMPFPSNIGLRVSLWLAGFSPVLAGRKLGTLGSIRTPEERLELLQRLLGSESHLTRQLALLLKMNGALSLAATTRFHAALGLEPHESAGSMSIQAPAPGSETREESLPAPPYIQPPIEGPTLGL